MDIIRNGEKIELTAQEIVQASEENLKNAIRCEIEYILDNQLDDVVSFRNYQNVWFGDYTSESDCREDFIEECITTIIESETIPFNDDIAFNKMVEEAIFDLADFYDLTADGSEEE